MNVLIVMPLGEFGGGAEQMLATYFSANRDSSKVSLHFLFLGDGGLATMARACGYPVKVINAGRLRHVGRWLSAQIQIVKLLSEWTIDRVLAWMPKAGMYVALPTRVRGIPLFMWRHDIPSQLHRRDKWVMQVGRVRNVACSSKVAQSAFETLVPSIPSRPIHPAALRLPVCARKVSEIRDSLLFGNPGPVVGTIARLQPWKRVDLFLRAAAVLRRSLPELCVVVVGGESHGLSKGHGEELKRLGVRLLGDAVHFVGEQRNVGDWLEVMDLFVLPSVGEPFGIALVEALAAGKPVVACAGGGPEEIITGQVVGRVLNRDPHPSEMAQAMCGLLDKSMLDLAAIVNVKAAIRFSPENMVQQIDSWLQEAIL